ncbi:hypothetical protein C9J27_04075 [Photobacterium kishitanii]|uniref:Uncharacterized protein n=2 Tax=Photobacterium kishitanii TaxID=318456 RepID=A0A2T3KKX5_9GAMM|nr:hypothetical protein C9J27_04075 [Photobacterium kishitanii]
MSVSAIDGFNGSLEFSQSSDEPVTITLKGTGKVSSVLDVSSLANSPHALIPFFGNVGMKPRVVNHVEIFSFTNIANGMVFELELGLQLQDFSIKVFEIGKKDLPQFNSLHWTPANIKENPFLVIKTIINALSDCSNIFIPVEKRQLQLLSLNDQDLCILNALIPAGGYSLYCAHSLTVGCMSAAFKILSNGETGKPFAQVVVIGELNGESTIIGRSEPLSELSTNTDTSGLDSGLIAELSIVCNAGHSNDFIVNVIINAVTHHKNADIDFNNTFSALELIEAENENWMFYEDQDDGLYSIVPLDEKDNDLNVEFHFDSEKDVYEYLLENAEHHRQLHAKALFFIRKHNKREFNFFANQIPGFSEAIERIENITSF